jgi:hypothetical protein
VVVRRASGAHRGPPALPPARAQVYNRTVVTDAVILALVVLPWMAAVGIGLRRRQRRGRAAREATASAVSHVLAAALVDEDPDELAMRAAYELTCLLDLLDSRWEWRADPQPLAVLRADGTVRAGPFPWNVHRDGLPPHGLQRELVAGGHHYGWWVMVPDGPVAASDEQLRGAALITDLVAQSLERHGHEAIECDRGDGQAAA